jgi:hypothetical protein
MQFFQAQMSGALPEWHSISWRKSAHLTDGADAQLDLVGGFYDAGGEAIAAVLLLCCFEVDRLQSLHGMRMLLCCCSSSSSSRRVVTRDATDAGNHVAMTAAASQLSKHHSCCPAVANQQDAFLVVMG